MNNPAHATSFTRTLRLKVKREAYSWLSGAAVEVNQVWNWTNATSIDAADRNRRAKARWLSGFDLCALSAGATEYFERIGADTLQRVCCEYATRRRAAKRPKLRSRVSRGPQGLRQLVVRQWQCPECGAEQDRDVNAAKNLLTAGSRCRTSVSGNESSDSLAFSPQRIARSRDRIETARTAA